MKISVIVTNWNGVSLLKKNLEKVILNSPEAQEIIVADDASEDQSLEFVKDLQKKYPILKIISHQKNFGFGENSNNAVKESLGGLVVLLNNDINPHKNYIKECLVHFKNLNVFGVGFAELGHENWARIFWKDGYLQHEPGTDISKTHISAWISGGSCILRKDIFLKLGGFDQIYAPFYSEDLDLGYRAWKSGYTLLWEPKSIVEHHHGTTISKFPKKFLDYVKERNRLLTVWRNITDKDLLHSNKIALISRIFLGPNYIKIIRAAQKQIRKFPSPIILPKLSDKEIFSLFSK
jgi:O-antigen biosynthesis protein